LYGDIKQGASVPCFFMVYVYRVTQKEGAYADMLLVEGNPVKDVTVMADWKSNLKVIMKDGKIFKNTLSKDNL